MVGTNVSYRIISVRFVHVTKFERVREWDESLGMVSFGISFKLHTPHTNVRIIFWGGTYWARAWVELSWVHTRDWIAYDKVHFCAEQRQCAIERKKNTEGMRDT